MIHRMGGSALDERPIGVFDSGLGGLTTVRELCRLLPEEDIVYFGDTGRVPYGSRSRETIIKYARQDVAFLRTFDLKAVVIACGTVSTTALDVLAAENELPVLGVVAPAAQAAARQAVRVVESGGRRIPENAGRSASVSRPDPGKLTSRELADIRRRVMDGEKISF